MIATMTSNLSSKEVPPSGFSSAPLPTPSVVSAPVTAATTTNGDTMDLNISHEAIPAAVSGSAHASTGFNRLPREVIIMIGRNLKKQEDLASFMHTSRQTHFLLGDDLIKKNMKATYKAFIRDSKRIRGSYSGLSRLFDRTCYPELGPISCLSTAVKGNNRAMLVHILALKVLKPTTRVYTDALATAVQTRNLEFVKLLIEAGADPTLECTHVCGNILNMIGYRPNNDTNRKVDEDMLLALLPAVSKKFIRETGSRYDNNGVRLLTNAIDQSMYRAVRYLMKRGAPGTHVLLRVLKSPKSLWRHKLDGFKRCRKFYQVLVENMGMKIDVSCLEAGLTHWSEDVRDLFWCNESLGLDEFWRMCLDE